MSAGLLNGKSNVRNRGSNPVAVGRREPARQYLVQVLAANQRDQDGIRRCHWLDKKVHRDRGGLGRRLRQRCEVHHVRGSSLMARVRPAGGVEVDVAADAFSGSTHGLVGMHVDLFALDRAPHSFDEHVVALASLAVHRDADALPVQQSGELAARELAALVGVEDLRLAVWGDRLLDRVIAERRRTTGTNSRSLTTGASPPPRACLRQPCTTLALMPCDIATFATDALGAPPLGQHLRLHLPVVAPPSRPLLACHRVHLSFYVDTIVIAKRFSSR